MVETVLTSWILALIAILLIVIKTPRKTYKEGLIDGMMIATVNIILIEIVIYLICK
tara:strand:+ start:3930 stop:4097 length:168 start_codon:yes stop_codon:yes gene_type:complete